MKFQRRQILRLAASAAALPLAPHIAKAQTYPSRSITMIVGFRRAALRTPLRGY
jgi:tripartite-type tricarboxylate transporter receptor subunit TctC